MGTERTSPAPGLAWLGTLQSALRGRDRAAQAVAEGVCPGSALEAGDLDHGL